VIRCAWIVAINITEHKRRFVKSIRTEVRRVVKQRNSGKELAAQADRISPSHKTCERRVTQRYSLHGSADAEQSYFLPPFLFRQAVDLQQRGKCLDHKFV